MNLYQRLYYNLEGKIKKIGFRKISKASLFLLVGLNIYTYTSSKEFYWNSSNDHLTDLLGHHALPCVVAGGLINYLSGGLSNLTIATSAGLVNSLIEVKRDGHDPKVGCSINDISAGFSYLGLAIYLNKRKHKK